VRLRATTVVGLERALAHSWAPEGKGVRCPGWDPDWGRLWCRRAGDGRRSTGRHRQWMAGRPQQPSSEATRSRYGRRTPGVKLLKPPEPGPPDPASEAREISGWLWTTACCPSHRVVSVTPVVGPSPASARPSAGISRRPDRRPAGGREVSATPGHHGASHRFAQAVDDGVDGKVMSAGTHPGGSGRCAGAYAPHTKGMTG